MADHHGPINVNVNVSQSQSQVQGQNQNDNTGAVGCLGLVVFVVVAAGISKAFEASPVLGVIIVAILVIAVAGGIYGWITTQQEEKRAEAARVAAEAKAAAVRADIESRAAIDAVGGCGWCGYPESHRGANGYPVHPRDWHALDVEEAVHAATGRPGANPAPRPVTQRPAAPPPTPQAPLRREITTPPAPPVARQPSAAPLLPRTSKHSAGMRRPPRVEQQDDLLAQLRYDENGECQWCGSPTEHCNEHGRVLHPAKFHKAEYEAERALRDNGTAPA